MTEQKVEFNPLDALKIAPNGLPISDNKTSKPAAKKQWQTKRQESHPDKSLEAKERMTVQISAETIERVKDAVYWDRLTFAQFTEQALEDALKKFEKQRGESYPKRKSELKPGRPIK